MSLVIHLTFINLLSLLILLLKHPAADIYTNALFTYYNKMWVLDSDLTKLTQHLVVTDGQQRKVKEIILLAT